MSNAVASRRRKFTRGEAADTAQRWAVEGVLVARRTGGIWGLVRWVSTQVDRLPGWEDSWVRLFHMSADLRCETRRLLGSHGGHRLRPVWERQCEGEATIGAGIGARSRIGQLGW